MIEAQVGICSVFANYPSHRNNQWGSGVKASQPYKLTREPLISLKLDSPGWWQASLLSYGALVQATRWSKSLSYGELCCPRALVVHQHQLSISCPSASVVHHPQLSISLSCPSALVVHQHQLSISCPSSSVVHQPQLSISLSCPRAISRHHHPCTIHATSSSSPGVWVGGCWDHT